MLPKISNQTLTLFICVTMLLLIILGSFNGGVNASRRRKIEIAKKVGAALVIAAKNRKFLTFLPLPFPLPIPVFKNYQPVIHDPLFFKHQLVKQHIGGIGGGIGGFG